MNAYRAYRAGQSVEDSCRACKTDRIHTVVPLTTRGGRYASRAAFVTASTTIAAARASTR
jgi:hypothetical protein